MRFTSKLIALIGACLLAVPGLAIADESVDAQLKQLNDRMEQMEGQLDEANAQVAAQEEVLSEIELGETRRSANSLSAFIEATEIEAWVAASYNINFRNPDKTPGLAGSQGRTNYGSFQGLNEPGYPESNTFQFDQAWISINKAPTEESRAGYSLDIVMGQQNNLSASSITGLGVYAASASYMMPLLDGLTVAGGVLPTAQGAEVLQTTQNLNISRGIEWGTQPITNLGFTGTLDFGGGLTAMIGMLNNSSGLVATDVNNGKALTSRLNYSADMFSIGAGANWAKTETAGIVTVGEHTLFNVVASIDPTDNLTAYIDYTLNVRKPLAGGKTTVHGISVATRLAVLDTTGIAVRGEVVIDGDGIFGAVGNTGTGNLWGITGTIDHALTDNLTSKIEVRHDGISDGYRAGGDGFWNSAGTATDKKNQTIFIAQLVYEF